MQYVLEFFCFLNKIILKLSGWAFTEVSKNRNPLA